jgi:hypothetical protein
MPFVILPTNSISGGYDVTNSLRFNSGSSDNLTKTFGTSGTSDKIKTFSFWLKRSTSSTEVVIVSAGSATRDFIRFESTGELRVRLSGGSADLITTQLFRDVSAWYHVVIAFDTPQATASNRIKIYVNGSQVTAFGTATYPSQNATIKLGTNNPNHIGNDSEQTNPYFNGYMSEFYMIDGQALTPTSFGETDFDTGIWKPKAFSGSYGTNGFSLFFKNSASLGTDSSGNGNTFTVNNLTSVDQSTDTPTNNFATFNALRSTAGLVNFTEGNLKATALTDANTFFHTAYSSIGVTKGKWYAEFKCAVGGNPANNIIVGGGSFEYSQDSGNQNGNAVGLTTYNGVGSFTVDNVATTGLTTYTAGDIIGVYLNVDDSEISFYKNGVQVSTTRTLTKTASNGITYFITIVRNVDGVFTSWEANFGNAPFTIASGNADANGYGNFEYAVPSGYYALNTKNLAQYG